MEFPEAIGLSQLLGIVLDFGFVAAFLLIVMWILARSPFSMNLQFHGGVEVGKNGIDKQRTTNYSQTVNEQHHADQRAELPQVIEAPRPQETEAAPKAGTENTTPLRHG